MLLPVVWGCQYSSVNRKLRAGGCMGPLPDAKSHRSRAARDQMHSSIAAHIHIIVCSVVMHHYNLAENCDGRTDISPTVPRAPILPIHTHIMSTWDCGIQVAS